MEIQLKQINLSQSRKAYFARHLRQRKHKVEPKALQKLNQFSNAAIFIAPHQQTNRSASKNSEIVQYTRTELTEMKSPTNPISSLNPEIYQNKTISIGLEAGSGKKGRPNSMLRESPQSPVSIRSASTPKKRSHYLSVVSRLPEMKRAISTLL